MTDRKDFDMYSSFNDKKTSRKKDYKKLRQNKEEFGSESNFQKDLSKNIESFSDWVDKMTKEHENKPS